MKDYEVVDPNTVTDTEAREYMLGPLWVIKLGAFLASVGALAIYG